MSNGSSKRRRRESKDELRGAINELEDAVQNLVRGARDEFTARTAESLRETAERLRAGLSSGTANSGDAGDLRARSRKLYRDPSRGRIAGVCAGFAQYFGIETWVARCIAVTGFIFVGQLTLPAYIIAWFLLEKRPRFEDPERTAQWRNDHRSPAPEFGPRFSPRRSLRNIEADLREAELRLRRAESHVTSNQYQLRKELHALDR